MKRLYEFSESLLLPVLLVLAVVILIPLGFALLRPSPADPLIPTSTAITPSSEPTSTQSSQLSTIDSSTLGIVFGETSPSGERTIIWIAPVENPADRRQVGEITHKAAYPPSGSVSPDGKTLAYYRVPPEADVASARTDGGEVWLLNLDGSGQRQVAGQAGFVAAWSPDSGSIVYGAPLPIDNPEDPEVRFRTDVVRVNPDGSNPETLFSDSKARALQPLGWSAAGDRFYVARLDANQTWDVMAWNQNTRKVETTATLPQVGQIRSFSLSPAGDRLVLDVLTAGEEQLTLFDLAQGNPRTIATLSPGSSQGLHLGALWSSDGKELLINNPGKMPAERMQSYNPNQQNQPVPIPTLQPVDNPQLTPIRWSPDRSWIALRNYADPALPIYLQKMDGSAPMILTSTDEGATLTLLGWILSK